MTVTSYCSPNKGLVEVKDLTALVLEITGERLATTRAANMVSCIVYCFVVEMKMNFYKVNNTRMHLFVCIICDLR